MTAAARRIKALEAMVKALRASEEVYLAVLAADGITATAAPVGWAAKLRPQQRFIMGVLIRAYPRYVDPYDIEAVLPARDRAADRDVKLVRTVIAQIRQRLGPVIENEYGLGYRLTKAFAEANPTPGRGAI